MTKNNFLVLITLAALICCINSHIVEYEGQKVQSFTLLYSRFVFSDFDDVENDLNDTYAKVDMKIFANRHDDMNCKVYFFLVDY